VKFQTNKFEDPQNDKKKIKDSGTSKYKNKKHKFFEDPQNDKKKNLKTSK
jgi:hypothetical protein